MKLLYSYMRRLCAYITDRLYQFKRFLQLSIDGLGLSCPVFTKVTGILPVALVCFQFVCFAQESPLNREATGNILTGKVTSTTDGQPLRGATISVGERYTITDNKGEFSIRLADNKGILKVQHIGYQEQSIAFEPETEYIDIRLISTESEIEEVEVISTGYQQLPKERSTGSFVQIDNELLNRRISTNILDRIEDVAAGVVFPKYNSTELGNQPRIAIRGRSTLFADAEPLIILDNFPYSGAVENINPNDVATVTILKDGAAASIWGAQSGNGVIVITTKQGKYGKRPSISFTGNTTFSDKPDLYYAPQLSARDMVDVEKFLYEKGAYTSRLRTAYQPVSPVVELLLAMENGDIDKGVGLAQLDRFKETDNRDQLRKYFYEHQINQQYNVNLSGSSDIQQYFVSLGYDNNTGGMVGSRHQRYTLNARNAHFLFDRRLSLNTQILFTARDSKDPHTISINYPYELLRDEQGNSLTAVGNVRTQYADTVGGGKLLDWHFRPYDEIGQRGNNRASTDLRVNVGIDYTIFQGMRASVKYQYGRFYNSGVIWYGEDSHYVRSLVNQFSQLDVLSGDVLRRVPEGEIRINSLGSGRSHNVRGQLDYSRDWSEDHSISAMTVIELNDNRNELSNQHVYGYDPATATFATVDFINPLPRYYGGSQRLQNSNHLSWTRNRFRSYLANVSYSYQKKYTVYGSSRRDESNLFGVKTNQKGVPLWSTGLLWNLAEENFVQKAWLDDLKLRMSYGVQGNVDQSVSALLSAVYPNYQNVYGSPLAVVDNPPNPSLRWEKVKSYNVGIDFSLFKDIVRGQIDGYYKVGTDLIGNSPIAAQTGMIQYRGNTADIFSKGVDVALKINPLRGPVSWQANILYNYVRDEVTRYKVQQSSNLQYMMYNYMNPFEGRPQSALFSLKYAGLDEAGNPLVYHNGEVSDDYTAVASSRDIYNMVYHGPRTPSHFGAFRNDFYYRGFSLSINMVYQLGYYFRRQSLYNSNLYSPDFGYRGVADYSLRWQTEGDELRTDVPSLVYPANSNRAAVYTYSDALVEKADHVRLQDISIGYNIEESKQQLLNNLRVSIYLNNLPIIWRANRHGIDPNVFQSVYPTPRTYSFNITKSF